MPFTKEDYNKFTMYTENDYFNDNNIYNGNNSFLFYSPSNFNNPDIYVNEASYKQHPIQNTTTSIFSVFHNNNNQLNPPILFGNNYNNSGLGLFGNYNNNLFE